MKNKNSKKSMIVIPCKYVDVDYITPLVKSIRESGNNDMICVVDSDSTDKTYFSKIQPYNVIIEDISNRNYIDGAVWHCYTKYKDIDYFYFLHDSMIVNENLEPIKRNYFTAFCYGEIIHWDSETQKNYCIDSINSLGYSVTEKDFENIPGLFGITFFCKREVLDELWDLGLHKILPSNKEQMCGSERIWPYFLWKIGIDVRISNLRNFWIYDQKTNYISKIHPQNRRL